MGFTVPARARKRNNGFEHIIHHATTFHLSCCTIPDLVTIGGAWFEKHRAPTSFLVFLLRAPIVRHSP